MPQQNCTHALGRTATHDERVLGQWHAREQGHSFAHPRHRLELELGATLGQPRYWDEHGTRIAARFLSARQTEGRDDPEVLQIQLRRSATTSCTPYWRKRYKDSAQLLTTRPRRVCTT